MSQFDELRTLLLEWGESKYLPLLEEAKQLKQVNYPIIHLATYITRITQIRIISIVYNTLDIKLVSSSITNIITISL